jgi:predicted flap endonuclease-1-like 5' DNA nuclease
LFPKWFWITLLGVPIGLMIVWFLRWFFLPSDQRTAALEIEIPRSDGKRHPIKKDDFRLLKGIGPKSAAALFQAKIFSFEQLGRMDLEKLEAILKNNNLPSRGAPFWQKQAALAAAGEWKLLEKLQK